MTPLRLFIIFLLVFSIVKIILFYRYFKSFKLPSISKDEIQAFDEEEDKAFFEEDDF